MSYDVRKLWSQKSTQMDYQGWGSTEYYSVTATTLAEMADDKAVLTASGTGGQIPPIGFSHSANRDLKVASKDAGPGLVERIVSVRYQWFPNGFPTQTGGTDPQQSAVTITWGRLSRLMDQGRDISGHPITNSVGDAIDPPPQIDMGSRSLTIVRREREYKPEIADRFENTVNIRDMFAGGRRFPAGSVLCQTIIPAESYTTKTVGISIAYTLEVRTRFSRAAGVPLTEIDKHPFRYWHVDRGRRSFYSAGSGVSKTPGDLYDKISSSASELQPVTDAVLLGGDGAPVNLDSYVVTSGRKAPAKNYVLPAVRSGGPIHHDVKTQGGFVVMLGWEIYEYDDLLELGL